MLKILNNKNTDETDFVVVKNVSNSLSDKNKNNDVSNKILFLSFVVFQIFISDVMCFLILYCLYDTERVNEYAVFFVGCVFCVIFVFFDIVCAITVSDEHVFFSNCVNIKKIGIMYAYHFL